MPVTLYMLTYFILKTNTFLIFIFIYLFIWLPRVLAATCRLLSCEIEDLAP